jgi:methylated-DNA-[protein]-cysteine S-methyltransferase
MKTRTTKQPAVAPADILEGKLTPGMNFAQKVWALTARIPAGYVATYQQIAQALDSRAYRAVGQALHNNPFAPQVPCHRVVGANGRLTGYAGGLAKKERLLTAEGVPCQAGRVIDLQGHRHPL